MTRCAQYKEFIYSSKLLRFFSLLINLKYSYTLCTTHTLSPLTLGICLSLLFLLTHLSPLRAFPTTAVSRTSSKPSSSSRPPVPSQQPIEAAQGAVPRQPQSQAQPSPQVEAEGKGSQSVIVMATVSCLLVLFRFVGHVSTQSMFVVHTDGDGLCCGVGGFLGEGGWSSSSSSCRSIQVHLLDYFWVISFDFRLRSSRKASSSASSESSDCSATVTVSSFSQESWFLWKVSFLFSLWGHFCFFFSFSIFNQCVFWCMTVFLVLANLILLFSFPSPPCNCSASRRGSVSSEKQKRRSKDTSRARSKSPFRSFRWPKKSRPEAAEASAYSDDEDNLRRPMGKISIKTGWGWKVLVQDWGVGSIQSRRNHHHLLLGLSHFFFPFKLHLWCMI